MGLLLDKVLFNYFLELVISFFILIHNIKYNFYPIKSFFSDKIWNKWFFFLLLLTLCGLIFGIPNFNFKFLSALILSSVFSSVMNFNRELEYNGLKLFVLGMTLYALFFYLGFFSGNFYFSKGRLYLFEENPNSLSTRVALSIFISFFLFLKSKKYIQKLIYFVPTITLSPFLLLFGSKGSFLMVGIAVILYYLLYGDVKFKKKIFPIFITFFVFLRYIFDSLIESTVGQRFLQDGNDLGTRNTLWEIALNKIFLKYPMGVGEIRYFQLMEKEFGIALDTHNLFLYILVTSGFIGLIIFILPLLTLIKDHFKLYLKSREPFYLVLLVFLLLLMSKTGGILSYLIMWYFISFIHSNLKFKKNA